MKIMRFLLKLIICLLPLAVMVLSFVVPAYLIYHDMERDELTIQQKYQEKKANYDQLVAIAEGCIKEGSGINILEGLNNSNIRYEIHHDGENIIFHYSIKIEGSSYYTDLTLSGDYKVLNEEGRKLEDFEAFKKSVHRDANFAATILGYICAIIIFAIFWPINKLIAWLLKRKNKKAGN